MKQSVTPWVMRTCPVCGKEFLPAGQHSWKIGNSFSKQELVCTYSCMRKWEKNPKKRSRVCENGNKIKVRVIETGEVFDSITKCAKKLKTSTSSIHHCIYNGRTARGLHVEKVKEDA